MRLRRFFASRFVLAVLLSLPLAGLAAEAADSADLAAHSALYTLTLATARGDVTSASGTMSYEVIDACDGWAVRQRLAMTLTNRDGQDIDMLSDYTTYESKDGLHLRYRLHQTTDASVTSDIAGEASLESAGGPGEAHYTLPEDTTKKLPEGTLFPMAHTAAILAAAQAGKKLLQIPLFDGTSAEGVQDSSIAIIDWVGPKAGKWPELAALPSGRVRIAFFDRGNEVVQPDFEVGMRYWDNGISDELVMDFGDFVMSGQLKTLKVPHKGC